MKAIAIGFAAGLLFGAGLAIARMTDPRVVLAFLDVTGAWNPSLLVVMAGAASTFGAIYWLTRRGVHRSSRRRCGFQTSVRSTRDCSSAPRCSGSAGAWSACARDRRSPRSFGGNGSGRVFVVAMLAGIALAPRGRPAPR